MNGISIYTLPCVKQRACGKLLYSTGSSARGSVMTQRGGMQEQGGRSKRERYMHTRQFPVQSSYVAPAHNQLEIKRLISHPALSEHFLEISSCISLTRMESRITCKPITSKKSTASFRQDLPILGLRSTLLMTFLFPNGSSCWGVYHDLLDLHASVTFPQRLRLKRQVQNGEQTMSRLIQFSE